MIFNYFKIFNQDKNKTITNKNGVKIVEFEFFNKEPIENVITCLHYKFDKVIYFGYEEVINSRKKSTENFLKKHCDVKKVEFHSLPKDSLEKVLDTMRKEIQSEVDQGSQIYFDITGGESLILVAFGMLSNELNCPSHMFDIYADKLIEFNNESKFNLSISLEEHKIDLDLSRYIEMKGGIINQKLQKSLKEDSDIEFDEDISRIWKVAKKHIDKWNQFSDLLSKYILSDDNLQVSRQGKSILKTLQTLALSKIQTLKDLIDIVDDLGKEGILLNVEHENGKFRFKYKNQRIKECLCEGGSVLELQTFQTQKIDSDDCRVGVHLDWDGIIHTQDGGDVLNEIDVLSIKGNIPTFISCKSGKMSTPQTLHALYELNAITKRFGGKYAKKVLVTAQSLSDVNIDGATEMGIEVIVL